MRKTFRQEQVQQTLDVVTKTVPMKLQLQQNPSTEQFTQETLNRRQINHKLMVLPPPGRVVIEVDFYPC